MLIKMLILVAMLASSLPSNAQEPESPVRCTDSDQKIREICKNPELLELARNIELRFLTSVTAISLDNWKGIYSTKLGWAVEYQMCGIHIGQTDAINACIWKALGSLDTKLPPLFAQVDRITLRRSARSALDALESGSKIRWKTCVQAKSLSLDDGISSARDIAIGVSRACRPLAFDIATIITTKLDILDLYNAGSGVNLDRHTQLGNSIADPDGVVEYVLEARSAKRTKKPAADPKRKAVQG